MDFAISRRHFLAGIAAVSIVGCKKREVGLQFGLLNAIDAALARLADSQGFFARESILVVSALEPSGVDTVQRMTSVRNALDLGELGFPPLCSWIGQNRSRPVVIATVSGSSRTDQIFTLAGTGITSDPATLKGRAIGYTPNTVAHQYLSLLLAKAGLTLQDVRGFTGPQTILIDNLIHGDLDAAVLWEPNIRLAERQYTNRLQHGANVKDRGEPRSFVDTSLLVVADQIVAAPNVVQEKRSEVLKFLRALIDAETYLATNRAAAQQSIEQWAGLLPGDASQFFASSNFKVRLEVDLVKNSLADTMKWFRQTNPQAVVPPDFGAFIDSSLLREIDASRVSGA